MPAIENRQAKVHWAKQTAKDSPVANGSGFRRGRLVGGDLNVAREDANEPYVDGERFTNAQDFISTVTGNGNPTFQAQPGVVGHLAYLMLGQESVTTPITGEIVEHVATPAASGFWTTWWKEVGAAVGPLRQKFIDARMSSLRFEASSASKVAKITPSFVALDTETFGSSEAAGEESGEPMIYTQGEGRFKIDRGDGTLAVFSGHSSCAWTVEDNITPYYGDSVRPMEVVFGLGSVSIEGVTILVDAQGLQLYNYLIYGATAPTAGTQPQTLISPYGAYELDLQRGTAVTVSIVGATAGNWTLTFNGQTTANIAWNANNTAVQTAIENLSNVEPGDVRVVGGPLPGTAINIIFERHTQATITATFTGLTGGTNTLTQRGAFRQVKTEFPNVRWSPDVAIPANPDGGATEIALGGQARAVSPDPFIRITTRSGDVAYT